MSNVSTVMYGDTLRLLFTLIYCTAVVGVLIKILSASSSASTRYWSPHTRVTQSPSRLLDNDVNTIWNPAGGGSWPHRTLLNQPWSVVLVMGSPSGGRSFDSLQLRSASDGGHNPPQIMVTECGNSASTIGSCTGVTGGVKKTCNRVKNKEYQVRITTTVQRYSGTAIAVL